MRGESSGQHEVFSYVSLEERIPADHPLRTIRLRADAALKRLSPVFTEMYARGGRPSIPPERLLKAQLLIALYSVRSDRQFCESLGWNLLYRWFLGMTMDEAGFVASTFSKNRDLEFLRQGRVRFAPLVTRRVLPSDAPAVYADLARPEDTAVAVVFDWNAPGPWRTRIERASPLRGLVRAARRRRAEPAGSAARRDGRKLRFGLIGAGEIAVETAAALRAAGNCAITYTMDPRIALARSLAAPTEAAFASEAEAVLESADVDVVVVSTPHHLHAPLAIAAAEAGKHVVVEKPMATTVEDCDRMIAAARRCGVTLSVCYCQRFDPRVERARRLIEAGVLGDVLSTRISVGERRRADYWTQGLTGRSPGDWRGRVQSAGGGVLIMNACHVLDYVTWLVGSPIAEVAACTATLTHAVEVEDTVSMSYRYLSAALGTLEGTNALAAPRYEQQAIRGRSGLIVIGPGLRFWSERTVDGYEAGRWHDVRRLPPSAARRRYFAAFADAVLDGSPPPVGVDEARAVQAAIAAAYRSAASGAAEPVTPP